MRRVVWLAYASDDEPQADLLSTPLELAGYTVLSRGKIRVGESMIVGTNAALQQQIPIVLCATRAAIGDSECSQVVNAARTGSSPVLVVKMHRQVLLAGMRSDERVADFASDPHGAIEDLLVSLEHLFRLQTDQHLNETLTNSGEFLAALAPETSVDETALAEFLSQLRAGFISDRSARPFDTLRTLGLARGSVLTLAGLLTVGESPQSRLPLAVVNCFRYFGLTTSAPTAEPTIALGNVQQQIRAANEFVRLNTQSREGLVAKGPQTETTSEYPLESVREIVANAVAHRDYSLTGKRIHVNIFDDRLEVESPGTWVGVEIGSDPVPVDRLIGSSDSRNPLLAQALTGMRFLEGQGSGLPKAVEAANRANAPLPTVRIQSGNVVVTVHPDIRHSQLAVAIRELSDGEARHWRPAFGERPADVEEFFVSPRFYASQSPEDSDSLSLEEVATHPSRLKVILGAPGSGKTMLAYYLAKRFSTADSLAILLTARASPARGVLEEILADRIGLTGYEARTHQIDGLLENLHVTLLLDGLDELPLPSRSAIAQMVQQALARYPMLSVIVLSRPLPSLGLGSDTVFSIAPLSLDQIEAMVDHYVASNPNLVGGSESRNEIRPLIEMRLTPLELQAALSVYGASGTLPRSRRALWQSMVESLTSWDARRGLGSPSDSLLLPLYEGLAYDWVQQGTPVGWVLSQPKLEQRIAAELKRVMSTVPSDVRNLRNALVTRSPFFVNSGVGPDGELLFAFSHRQFLEFFAARAIMLRNDFPTEVADTIIRLAEAEQDDVIEMIFDEADAKVNHGARNLRTAVTSRKMSLSPGGLTRIDAILDSGPVRGWWSPDARD